MLEKHWIPSMENYKIVVIWRNYKEQATKYIEKESYRGVIGGKLISHFSAFCDDRDIIFFKNL